MTEKNSRNLNIIFVSLPILILALALLGAFLHYFDNVWWFDSLLHLLGGVWTGALFLHLFVVRTKLFQDNNSPLFTLIIISSFVAMIGVYWEFWEFFVDKNIATVYSPQVDTMADTIKDLALDMIGGMFLALFYWKKLK